MSTTQKPKKTRTASPTGDSSTGALFGPDELDQVIEGAALLGSGGGGSIAVARELRRVALEFTDNRGVMVTPVSAVSARATAAVAADVGASNTYVPKQEIATINAFNKLADLHFGATGDFDYVLPGEIGAENALAPFAVAAKLGIPIVDGDGSQRAIPTLGLSLYAISGVATSPTVIANVAGECAVLYAPDADRVEALMEPAVAAPAFADSAGMALWAMTGADLVKTVIPGGLDLARRIGVALAAARASGSDPVAAVLAVDGVHGRLLGKGTVTAVNVVQQGAFDVGSVVVKEKSGEEIIVYNQNENMIAWRSGEPAPLATAPDLICYLTPDGHALSNAEVKRGTTRNPSELCLLGLRAHSRLTTAKMIRRYESALRGLGYGGSYRPVLGSNADDEIVL